MQRELGPGRAKCRLYELTFLGVYFSLADDEGRSLKSRVYHVPPGGVPPYARTGDPDDGACSYGDVILL
jgi:hypothetical protein